MGNGVPVTTEVDNPGCDNPVVEAPKAADGAQLSSSIARISFTDTKGTGPAAGGAATVADMRSEIVPDDRIETVALRARHKGGGLTFDKLEGLRRLRVALREQKGCMRTSWDDVMANVENGLVFTELETLMAVAGDAVDRVIRTSERLIKETRAPDTHVVKKQPMGQLTPEQDKRGRQFAQEGQSLTEARTGQMPPYRGTPAPTQAIEIMPRTNLVRVAETHGGGSDPTPMMRDVKVTPHDGKAPFVLDMCPDTGCTQSMISEDVVSCQQLTVDTRLRKRVRAVNNQTLDCSGTVTFDIEFKGRSTEVIALVSSSITEEVLLSWQILKKLGVIPDGGLPFEVDVWRDVACTRSLISADQILPEEVPNDLDPERQREQIPMLEGTLAMQQALWTESVWPCLVDMDGRFLPTSMETGIYPFQKLAPKH